MDFSRICIKYIRHLATGVFETWKLQIYNIGDLFSLTMEAQQKENTSDHERQLQRNSLGRSSASPPPSSSSRLSSDDHMNPRGRMSADDLEQADLGQRRRGGDAVMATDRESKYVWISREYVNDIEKTTPGL